MPKRYSYTTPKGEFASSSLAAAAHACDKSTILNRCLTHPDQYQKIELPPVTPRPKIKYTYANKTAWPVSWAHYKGLAFDVRDEIWLHWCASNAKDPNLESTVDEFFLIMDTIQEHENDQEQVV